jgi:hypothetical protein
VKPVQIALLVIAGAAGGAIIMKVSERPAQQAALPPAVAQNTAPAPADQSLPAAPVAQPPNPEPAANAEPGDKPAPFPEHRTASHPKPVRHNTVPREPKPVEVAQNTPPPAPVAEPAPDPQPAAPQQTPAPPVEQPVPQQPVAAPAPAPEPPPPPPPRQVTLNAGTLIPIRLIDSLTTERNNPGDTFAATLDQPLVVDGLVIAEKRSRVEGRIVNADKGGKVKGVAELSLELTRIHLSDGQVINVHTDSFEKHAESTRGTDATKVGAGAAIGAIIGAIAGGGKGAAVGAGAGGGVGAGDVLLTRGKPATLASETRITFRLDQPLTVTEKRS